MKTRMSRSSGLMLLAGILGFAVGCQSKPPLAAREAGYPQDKVEARALFAESCVKCHGVDGRAKTFRGWLLGAQNFTDPIWQGTTTDDEITKAIRTGPKAMPAFGHKLSVAEIAALAAFVRTFKPAS